MTFVDFGMDFDVVVDIDINVFNQVWFVAVDVNEDA